MNAARKPQLRTVAKYLLFFGAGAITGLNLANSLYINHLPGSIEDFSADRVHDASFNAAYIASALSCLRMNEREQGVARLERLLDFQMSGVDIWSANVKDPQMLKDARRQLPSVKWYRTIVPAQSESKVTVDRVLAQIPFPPQSALKSKSPVRRFWQLHHK